MRSWDSGGAGKTLYSCRPYHLPNGRWPLAVQTKARKVLREIVYGICGLCGHDNPHDQGGRCDEFLPGIYRVGEPGDTCDCNVYLIAERETVRSKVSRAGRHSPEDYPN